MAKEAQALPLPNLKSKQLLPPITLLCLTLAMLWPAPRYLSTRLIGNNIDNWIFYWNNWWVKQASTSEATWYFTDKLFFPEGTSLVAHSHSLLNSWGANLFATLVNPITAYNLMFILGIWLSGIGMFYLVRHLTKHELAAYTSAFVYMFAPYHLTQALAHVHLGAIQWWPFFALLWVQWWQAQRRDWLMVLLIPLTLTATLASGLQLGVLLVLWTAVYTLAHLHTTGHSWGSLKQLALMALLTLLLCAPLLSPILANLGEIASNTATFNEGFSKQTDLLAYITPTTLNPFWGETMQPIYETFTANRTAMPYIGLTVLGLALLAVYKEPRARFWVGSSLLWFLLALGSAPRLNGIVYEQFPLPFRWLGELFPLSAVRAPDRFNLLLLFSIAVLAGWGVTHLKKQWLMVPLTLILVAEYAVWPLPMWDNIPPASPILNQLEEGAILDLPMGYSRSKLWLYYQTEHEHPIIEGHVSRYTDQTYATIANTPVLQTFYHSAEPPVYLTKPITPPAESLTGADLVALQALGVRYIVRHIPYETQSNFFWQTWPLTPNKTDEAIWLYDLQTPASWQAGDRPQAVGAGLLLIGSELQLADGQLQGRFVFASSATEETPCTLTIAEQETHFLLMQAPLTWQTITLPAPHTAETMLLDCGQPIQLPQQIKAGRLVRSAQETNFGDTIHLMGWDWQVRETDLALKLHWQTSQPIPEDYKLFVHLLDEAGTVVAQYDAMPCNWGCPTSSWQVGQPIIDEAMLSLLGVANGRYTLALGLYHPTTGERLSIANTLDNRYLLEDHPLFITHTPE